MDAQSPEEMTMSRKPATALQKIQSRVEAAMNSVEVARLTPREYDSIKQLRQSLDDACLAGDKAAAMRAEEMIFTVIKQGPPMRD